MTNLQLLLLVLLVLSGVYTAMAAALITSAIGLALTSIILSILIYQLGAPFAAVFELSVCAGLITVVFVSAISLTRRPSIQEEKELALRRLKRFIWLPIIVIIVGAALYALNSAPQLPAPLQAKSSLGVREALWDLRRIDMIGQLLIILSGVFGVVVLFKGWNRKGAKDL